ncbi:amidohydrolase [Marasmius fiardii PR-910]|nr:amidohydrolase [Marasmius fiardii PR-910]
MSFKSDNPDSSSVGCFGRLFNRRKAGSRPRAATSPSYISPGSSTENRDQKSEKHHCYCPTCDFSFAEQSAWWHSESKTTLPPYELSIVEEIPSGAPYIDRALGTLNRKLRDLSLQLHEHPEIHFHEKFAHDLLSSFMEDHGFKVSRQYLGLSTAWRAEYTHGKGGRVVGINSEMDALSGLGHACGHNLIAISGCGVAIALKAALEATKTPGKIILLGTPAEEIGGGKIILLDRGGYDEMDLCIMCHPSPGPSHSFDVGSTNAMQHIEIEYFGKSAHAGSTPWEGTNALDAAFLAYSSISVLRQQMKPDYRVHGVIQGKDWLPNDYAKLTWIVRTPTHTELGALAERILNCFKAAALATSCEISIKTDAPYYELNQNPALAKHFEVVIKDHFHMETTCHGSTASTDFGNIGHRIPSLHPLYAIPTEPNGGNHTPAFARSAATEEAHEATMIVTNALALTAFRAIRDEAFFQEVVNSFKA